MCRVLAAANARVCHEIVMMASRSMCFSSNTKAKTMTMMRFVGNLVVVLVVESGRLLDNDPPE